MKFGKRLRNQVVETLPKWSDKFIDYKVLKKRLKSLTATISAGAPESGTTSADAPEIVPTSWKLQTEAGSNERGDGAVATANLDDAQVSGIVGQLDEERTAAVEVPPIASSATCRVSLPHEEAEFVKMLNKELEKFNDFFLEKEEEFVIRLQDLKEQVERLKGVCRTTEVGSCTGCDEQLNALRKAVVTIHGEMVLLENYSLLNYMGLCKILKKHDKLTGTPLKQEFITNVLHQPFYMTEVLSELVKQCEEQLQIVFPASAAAANGDAAGLDDSGDALPSGSSSPGPGEVSDDAGAAADREGDAVRLPAGALETEVNGIYRSTLAALKALQELRKPASPSVSVHEPVVFPPPEALGSFLVAS